MSAKEGLLYELTVSKLRALAKENNVSLVIEGLLEDSKATAKDDIIEILSKSRKITKKKIQDKISGKSTTKKKTKPKRMRILAHDRSVILERQNGKCDKCGKELDLIHKLYEIDHKNALADGGEDSLDNYHALCLECHRKKTRRETTRRAKTKRSSVTSNKATKQKTEYKCKLSASDREWECGKKRPSSSCLRREGLFSSGRCEHLTVSKK